MKRGIVLGIAISVLAAAAAITIVHCNSGGAVSCESFCRKYGECREEDPYYYYYYYYEDFEWTDEHQRECVSWCTDWRQDIEDEAERREYYCNMSCHKKADCDDFDECRWDCADYDYYYYGYPTYD